MNFDWPNAEIGRKMANGQLLFLALHTYIQQLSSNRMQACNQKLLLCCLKKCESHDVAIKQKSSLETAACA